ncbi:phosphatidylserine decarboxylase family protein [Flavobacteriales bacterium]|nr:phosphatidylserine decarboxylase family protein [Flavobacteriales bacterium]
MKFHKEGYPTLFVTIAFLVILNGSLNYFIPELSIVLYIFYVLSLALLITVIQFFRSPSREWNNNSENGIISPCDGKVVVIEEVEETEYFKEKRIQISIFMSPFNVHVNRNPITGIFKYVKYHPGLFLMAFNPKSSTENERSTIVIEHKSGAEVLFRQIAGFLARRIVVYCKEGQEAKQTDQMGFIKFGSRIDLFLPLDAKINVKLEDKVKGGVSNIADLV